VIEDVEHAGNHGERGVEAEEQRDQPEVADRRIREQSLQVVLEDRDVRAEQQRRESGRGNDPEPGIRTS